MNPRKRARPASIAVVRSAKREACFADACLTHLSSAAPVLGADVLNQAYPLPRLCASSTSGKSKQLALRIKTECCKGLAPAVPGGGSSRVVRSMDAAVQAPWMGSRRPWRGHPPGLLGRVPAIKGRFSHSNQRLLKPLTPPPAEEQKARAAGRTHLRRPTIYPLQLPHANRPLRSGSSAGCEWY